MKLEGVFPDGLVGCLTLEQVRVADRAIRLFTLIARTQIGMEALAGGGMLDCLMRAKSM